MLVAGVWQPGTNLLQLVAELSTVLQRPWDIRWTQYSGRCLLLFTLAYAVGIGMALSNTTATRRGEEHGSARWGDVFSIARRYRDKRGGNLILTQHFSIGWDGYRHKHNTNVLVVGGSGAGKTRGYCVPNILEAAGRDQNAPPCSIVCSDPKSEVLRKTGALLIARGYEVRVLDLTSPAASFCYNPLRYIQSDKDALRMIDTLIQATTPPDSKSSDPFWVKSETALLQALVLYLVHEAPEEEQNLPMVMEMLQAAEVREEDDEYESPLDMLFSRLEMRDPESIARKQYRVYKMAAGVVCSKRLLNQAVEKSLRTHNLKPKKGAQVMRKNEKITALYERLSR
ncbi:MAG: type IV secretory system conjugative DNA transfer family protein, partial [Ruthenibacterium lactatiformans]|nr:type IV secretory system conjugative DNA transfer family protein [Ruthenibacterium lactatiformans]